MTTAKRWLAALALTLGPGTAAAEPYFGFRLAFVVVPVPLPFPGVQFGVNFDGPGGGPGVRVNAETLILGSALGADVYYRLETDDLGSAVYLGGGGGTLVGVRYGGPELHALAGYEGRFASAVGLFVEGMPSYSLQTGRFYLRVNGGVNFHF